MDEPSEVAEVRTDAGHVFQAALIFDKHRTMQ